MLGAKSESDFETWFSLMLIDRWNIPVYERVPRSVLLEKESRSILSFDQGSKKKFPRWE